MMVAVADEPSNYKSDWPTHTTAQPGRLPAKPAWLSMHWELGPLTCMVLMIACVWVLLVCALCYSCRLLRRRQGPLPRLVPPRQLTLLSRPQWRLRP
jgi:hypothetical protein